MNNLLQTVIQSNTLNFLIIVAFFIWLVPKLNIDKKLLCKKNEIDNYVKESENEKNNAEKRLTEIQNKVEKLPKEIERIERSTKSSIENLSRKSQANIEEKIRDIDGNVARITDLETKKFKSGLTYMISQASINLACDNTKKQLENNRELHDKYISEAINEIDGMNL